MLPEVLAPWVEAADLLAPRWRRYLQRDLNNEPQAIELDKASALSRAQQFQLREALELFALGLRLDATRFLTAVNGSVAASAGSTLPSYCDFLSLHLRWDLASMVRMEGYQDGGSLCPWGGFFGDWTIETASEAFKEARQHVMKLRPRPKPSEIPSSEPRFRVGIHLPLRGGSETELGGLTAMVSLLQCIDRRSFTVSTIHVQVESPAFDPQQLSQFVQVLDSWRDQAVVEIKLVLPAATEDVYSNAQWSFLFEIFTLQSLSPSPQDPLSCSWSVFVECSSSPHHTTEALAVLCLKALAETDRISSLTVSNILQDATIAGRTARARSLASLMRFGGIEVISWRDRMLREAESVAAVFASGDLLRSNDSTATQELNESTPTPFPPAHASADPSSSRLKSLMIKIDGVALSPMTALHEVPVFVGPSLETVSIESPQHIIPWSAVEEILIACPRLLYLTLKTVLLSPATVSSVAIDASQAAGVRLATLESLSLDVVVNHVCVVSSLATVLHQFGAGLRKLCLRFRSRTTDLTQLPGVFAACILTSCTMLTALQLSRVNISSLVQRLSSGYEALVDLESLVLDDVVWELEDMALLITALSSKTHPLARSLRKLSITRRGDIPMDIVEALFRMLEVNRKLTEVTLIVPGLALRAPSIQQIATSHHQRSKPLGILSTRQKFAVLGVLAAKNIPWENDGMARVFKFAAPTERRRIKVAFG